MLPSRKADIAHDAYQPATWNKDSKCVVPYAIQLVQELFVFLNVPELPGSVVVLLQGCLLYTSPSPRD